MKLPNLFQLKLLIRTVSQVQTKMNTFLPNSREFVDKFNEYLIDQKTTATDLKNLVDIRKSPLDDPVFKNFIATHKTYVIRAIFQIVKLNVETNYLEMNSTAVVRKLFEKKNCKRLQN